MNWFKKMVIRWVREDWESETQKSCVGENLVSSREVEAVCDSDSVLNFRVFNAVGGRVVEFRTYDRQKDRSYTQTYIITNEQDFGDRIAKIATMESLKV
jgi:hypothetical protein